MVKKTPEEVQANRANMRELVRNYKLDRDALEAEYRKQMRELQPPRSFAWRGKPKLRL